MADLEQLLFSYYRLTESSDPESYTALILKSGNSVDKGRVALSRLAKTNKIPYRVFLLYFNKHWGIIP